MTTFPCPEPLNDEVVRRPFEIVVSSEAEVVVLFLSRGVHPGTLIAVEWSLFVVGCDNVLPQLRTNQFEQISKVSQHREVAQDRVLLLKHVVQEHHRQNPEYDIADNHHSSVSFALWSMSNQAQRKTNTCQREVNQTTNRGASVFYTGCPVYKHGVPARESTARFSSLRPTT
jgi:hypothetical protein